jgi:voltage-gated potassium channel
VLIFAIVTSILLVILETVTERGTPLGRALFVAEWILTGLFTIEYIARLIAVRRPAAYATSFYGIIDLLAILPAFASIVFAGAGTSSSSARYASCGSSASSSSRTS